GLKEDTLGLLAYEKPSSGLIMLREQVLGKERFDRAFRTYVEKWAFKHPQPDDFFRTIENVAGEDLNWFWRSWFVNNWKLDQAVTGLKYKKNDPKKGSIITIANFEKMPMPAVVEIKTKSGVRSRVSLPVEIWQRNNTWSFFNASTEEIESVTIDPDHALPDSNSDNNAWTSGKNEIGKDVVLDDYTGTFSSTMIPIKLVFSDNGDGKLMLQLPDNPIVPLESMGNDKFGLAQAGLEVQFNADKSAISLTVNGQKLAFSREKK
ncbi:MAG: M1 family peptidase, partial [Cyanobacteria bacterium]|nr:M1 family peptidase [Cyanobacteriota bacterium]